MVSYTIGWSIARSAPKLVWQNPKYVSIVKHHIPGTNKQLKVKSGTQIIDRAWRFLKEHISINQNVKAGSTLLRAKLRSAQCEYWYRNLIFGSAAANVAVRPCQRSCSNAAAISVFQF